MAAKSQVRGVVTSDKMDKTVVVAIERQVRHPVYGKIQRRTSKFMAHNEDNAAKIGISGTPFSIIVVNGKPTDTINGAYPIEAVKERLDQYIK